MATNVIRLARCERKLRTCEECDIWALRCTHCRCKCIECYKGPYFCDLDLVNYPEIPAFYHSLYIKLYCDDGVSFFHPAYLQMHEETVSAPDVPPAPRGYHLPFWCDTSSDGEEETKSAPRGEHLP